MPSSKASSAVELLVDHDRSDGPPLHRQLEAQLRDAVEDRDRARRTGARI